MAEHALPLGEDEDANSIHKHLYTPRDPTQDRIATTIGLAGDAFVRATEGESENAAVPAAHARPIGNNRPAFFDDFDGLLEILGQLGAWLEEDPRRGEFLDHLRTAFGDGEMLSVLFRKMFPDQKPSAPPAPGQLPLTPRHLEILREAAGGYTQREIGERLDIAGYTVNAHFQTIYKRTGTNRPLQAVAVAISKGLLPLSVGDFVRLASGYGERNGSAFDTFLTDEIGTANQCPGKHLAEMGLFLLTLSAAAGGVMAGRQAVAHGRICKLDAQGKVICTLENERLAIPRMVAVAPPTAAQYGFRPGNLFLCQNHIPYHGLNRGEILEFTPDWELVNAFYGGKDLGTRIAHVPGLCFTRSGRLLVASSGVTDRILAFEAGGRIVRSWADTNPTQMCADAEGNIYAAEYSSAGCQVKVFRESGNLLRAFAPSEPGISYPGIAVNSLGEVFVHQRQNEKSEVVVFSKEGSRLRAFPCPHPSYGRLAIDAQDRVYLCCEHSRAIRVFSPHGEPLQVFNLKGIKPQTLILAENGSLWVCGEAC